MVRFERVDEDVRPEMSARVALFEKAQKEPSGGEGGGPESRRLFVPTEALLGDEGEKFVFVVDESSRARRRAVAVAGRANGLAEVVSGLAEGDEVVVSGHDRFGDGDPVRIAAR
jgi:multidrug efflux pump subunit AcrA (membrane-fusion protein)